MGLPLHIIEAEDPVGELGHGIQVPVQYRGVKEDAPREACFMAWATRPAISLAPSQSKGLRSTIRKGWWFSSRMILRWTEVNVLLTSSSTMSSLSSVIEDARADGR